MQSFTRRVFTMRETFRFVSRCRVCIRSLCRAIGDLLWRRFKPFRLMLVCCFLLVADVSLDALVDERGPDCALEAFGWLCNALSESFDESLHPRAHAQAPASSAPPMFRYRSKQGREGYTNIPSAVSDARPDTFSELDLSEISLHTELSPNAQRLIDAKHRELAASPHCTTARALQGDIWGRKFWTHWIPESSLGMWVRQHPALALVLSVALLLLLITPRMVRNVPALRWAKVLMHGLPLLAFVGLFAWMTENMVAIRDAARTTAAHCEVPNGLASSGHPVRDWSSMQQKRRVQLQRVQALIEEMKASSRGVSSDAPHASSP